MCLEMKNVFEKIKEKIEKHKKKPYHWRTRLRSASGKVSPKIICPGPPLRSLLTACGPQIAKSNLLPRRPNLSPQLPAPPHSPRRHRPPFRRRRPPSRAGRSPDLLLPLSAATIERQAVAAVHVPERAHVRRRRARPRAPRVDPCTTVTSYVGPCTAVSSYIAAQPAAPWFGRTLPFLYLAPTRCL